MSAWHKLYDKDYSKKFEGENAGDKIRGAKLFKAKCAACHMIEEGKGSTQGPNLYNMLGKQPDGKYGRHCGSEVGKAKSDEYNLYSGSMVDYGKEKDPLIWNASHLLIYLKNPKKYTPGTKMVFAGLKKDKECADLLAYMESTSADDVDADAAKKAGVGFDKVTYKNNKA